VRDPVRLAVVDVDGCLTPGEAQDWNWRALRSLQCLNRRARRGETVPAVTLCTGRQEPYVEALMQAIGAYLPGIYENGCGLYFPDRYRFAEHPSITAETRKALTEAKAIIHRQVVVPGLGYFQPGKEASLTLYPLPGTSVNRLLGVVADVFAGHGTIFAVQASVSCVDVTPAGIDKGAGVRWLSQETGIPLPQMGGIGDSTSDLAFLSLVGQSAAPANATAEVRAAVSYSSAHDNGAGVVDILHHWCCQG
jgi:hydroxymethylpyrimidine pyrophosphatase-like HAD family hydrolase